MKKTYNITLNVTIDVQQAEGGRRTPWISFEGWKHGVVSDGNSFETEPVVRMTAENLEYIGKQVFEAAKEMFYEDDELRIESD